jgi:hypothetical protein
MRQHLLSLLVLLLCGISTHLHATSTHTPPAVNPILLNNLIYDEAQLYSRSRALFNGVLTAQNSACSLLTQHNGNDDVNEPWMSIVDALRHSVHSSSTSNSNAQSFAHRTAATWMAIGADIRRSHKSVQDRLTATELYCSAFHDQLLTDPNNCGIPGHACPTAANGMPECDKGKCSIQCNQPYYVSDGKQGCLYDPLAIDSPPTGKIVSYTLTLAYIQQYPFTKPMISVNGQVPGKLLIHSLI